MVSIVRVESCRYCIRKVSTDDLKQAYHLEFDRNWLARFELAQFEFYARTLVLCSRVFIRRSAICLDFAVNNCIVNDSLKLCKNWRFLANFEWESERGVKDLSITARVVIEKLDNRPRRRPVKISLDINLA